MKKSWTITAIATAFMFVGLGSIQAAPQAQDEGWYHQRDTFFQGNQWRNHVFDRVRQDLTRVQSFDFHGTDEFRLDRAQTALTELQTKMNEHRYDEPQLDEVIGTINRVMADNRLSPRDRDILNDDLSRLRDFRSNHDQWWH